MRNNVEMTIYDYAGSVRTCNDSELLRSFQICCDCTVTVNCRYYNSTISLLLPLGTAYWF